MSRLLTVFLGIAIFVPSVVISEGLPVCTQEEAIKKMRALSQARIELSRAHPEQPRRYALMAADTAMVGKTLASKDYSLACRKYDGIAKKYGVDIEKYAQKLAPMQSVGSTTGGCDVATASKVVNGLYPILKQNLDAQSLSAAQRQVKTKEFFDALQGITPLIQTRPDEACKAAEKIKRDFNLG